MFDSLGSQKDSKVEPKKRAVSNAVLRKTVGERFVRAREINGWQQSEAAGFMGYKNSTQISLIEQGKRMPPINIILMASDVFSVSTDYLLGISDEPERDPKTAEQFAMVRHLESMLKDHAQAVSGALLIHVKQGGSPVSTLRQMIETAQQVSEGIERFRVLNPKFDDMRGGAKVLAAIESAAKTVDQARSVVSRFDGLKEHGFRAAERRLGITHPLLE